MYIYILEKVIMNRTKKLKVKKTKTRYKSKLQAGGDNVRITRLAEEISAKLNNKQLKNAYNPTTKQKYNSELNHSKSILQFEKNKKIINNFNKAHNKSKSSSSSTTTTNSGLGTGSSKGFNKTTYGNGSLLVNLVLPVSRVPNPLYESGQSVPLVKNPLYESSPNPLRRLPT